MNIFGKRVRGSGARKSLFLCSTILRGRMAKDENEGGGAKGDGIEIGAGFADAAAALNGEAAPEKKPKAKAAPAQEPEGNEGDDGADGSEAAAGGAAGDEGGEGSEGSEGSEGGEGGNEGEEGDEKPKPKKDRNTAGYVRDLKRELRQERAARSAIEQRLANLEAGGLPKSRGDDNPTDTSGKPDVTDGKKYPLGVLDDGYISDMIEWAAETRVNSILEGQRRAETTKAEQDEAATRMSTLREKMETLTDQGSEQFDDFEDFVIEGGLKGDWKLTETTFTAAADADNGPAILYALAKDKKEALRVSQLSPYEQLKYVAKKDGEISAAKPKPRTKPGAGDPPNNAPRGRNGSTPIRPDTENLDDFRKLYYGK